jgi:hypothetical protein
MLFLSSTLIILFYFFLNMSTKIRPSTPPPLYKSSNDAVAAPSPIRNSTVASSKRNAYTPDRWSTDSHFSSSVHDISNLNDRLRDVDFDTPAKIFQNRHALHQFENVTPNIGSPVAGIHNQQFNYDSDAETTGTQTSTQSETPRSLSPEVDDLSPSVNYATPPLPNEHSPSDSTDSHSTPRPLSAASISRPTTPSQFVFKKPEYNSHYHHTHFHHLEKKDTVFHDLKKFFKKNQDKKKKKSLLLDDTSSVQSGGSSVYSRQSDLSFANEFNKNLEGRYGKWGKLIYLAYHNVIMILK